MQVEVREGGNAVRKSQGMVGTRQREPLTPPPGLMWGVCLVVGLWL